MNGNGRGPAWAKTPAWINRHEYLTGAQIRLYTALRQMASPGDECSVSWTHLAAAANVSRRTVSTALAALVAVGAIRVLAERKGTRPARYQVYHSPFNVVRDAPQQPLFTPSPEPEPEKVWQRDPLPVDKSVTDGLKRIR